jgi:hypothetical protein
MEDNSVAEVELSAAYFWCHNTEQNDIQENGIQDNSTQQCVTHK